jgi:hypothetical protein
VTQGILGYARKNDSGQLKLERFGETLSESDVEISDDTFLLKEEDARKLMEPPRASRMALHPARANLRPGERQAFTIEVFDQYGQIFQASEPDWSATGGTIGSDGIYLAGAHAGFFGIHAVVDVLEIHGEVRISTAAEPEGPSPSPGAGAIAWRGTISPQKWMTFYTKVLTRFVGTPGLKLEVSFEAPAKPEETKTKVDETKTALRELGLSEDVQSH